MQDYVVIDLEMTGLHPKQDAVLEVGAVRVKGKKIADTLNFLVNPKRIVTKEVEELTGITQQMADSGVAPSEALHELMSFMGNDILVGHNIIYDYSFLKQIAANERIAFEKEAVDTLTLARKFLAVPEKKSLDSLCDYYGFHRENCHRAFDDAMATMQLYEMLEAGYYAQNEKDFVPKPLLYKPKRQTPATPAQKKHLNELLEYHKIDVDIPFETITRSDASRTIDKILSQYGRIPKS